MIEDIIATFKYRWKVFLLSFVAQFIVASLIHFGVQTPQFLRFLVLPNITTFKADILSPLPKNIDIFAPIRSRLEQKPNDFQLKRETGFAGLVYAESTFKDYDQTNSYIVIDNDSGKILAEKNITARIPVASLTKVMTAVVALDLALPAEEFTVSQKAAGIQPTKIGVVEGQKMTLEELLNAALLTSANDGVQVIKEGIDQKYGGSVFITAMNEKVKYLGLKDTHFENPQGFDGPGHYSSAADLAVLSHYALKNYPLIAEIAKKDYQFLPADENHKQFDLYNWNGLLDVYPGVYGLKIGNTENAGYTTVVASERDGRNVTVVLLGAPGVLERDMWASQLLDVGFAKLGLSEVGITEDLLRAKYSTWKYFQ